MSFLPGSRAGASPAVSHDGDRDNVRLGQVARPVRPFQNGWRFRKEAGCKRWRRLGPATRDWPGGCRKACSSGRGVAAGRQTDGASCPAGPRRYLQGAGTDGSVLPGGQKRSSCAAVQNETVDSGRLPRCRSMRPALPKGTGRAGALNRGCRSGRMNAADSRGTVVPVLRPRLPFKCGFSQVLLRRRAKMGPMAALRPVFISFRRPRWSGIIPWVNRHGTPASPSLPGADSRDHICDDRSTNRRNRRPHRRTS